MTLFKQTVEINFKEDGFELTKLKIDHNYNSTLGQSFEKMNHIFADWIREHGGDPEQILKDADFWN